MGNKKVERACFERVINCSPRISKIAQHYFNMITGYISYEKDNCEKPDFIFLNGDNALGIEHCLVDGLYNDFQDSFNRKNDSDKLSIVKNYKTDQNLDKGVDSTKNVIINTFQAVSRFSYSDFIDIFKRICSDHDNKAIGINEPGYRDNLKMLSVYNTLGCMVEIPLPSFIRSYEVKKNGKKYNQRIKGLPYTADIIRIIRNMKNFDFVVICAYTDAYSDVKYFDVNKFDDSLKEQNIKLYDEFRYYFPAYVDEGRVEKGDGEYTLKFLGRKRQ